MDAQSYLKQDGCDSVCLKLHFIPSQYKFEEFQGAKCLPDVIPFESLYV